MSAAAPHLGFVLLSAPVMPDDAALGAAFARLAPDDAPLERTEETSDERIAVQGFALASGETAFVTLVPIAVPDGEAEAAARHSLSTIALGWKLPPHAAHLVVMMTPATEGSADALTSLQRFTSLLAAVTQSAPAVGVYFGNATHDARFFVETAAEPALVPRIVLWNGVSVASDGDGRVSLLSLGMTQLGLPDLLLTAPRDQRGKAMEWLFELLAYLVDYGAALPEGHTVGPTAQDRWKVRYVVSPRDPAVQVWRVDVPGEVVGASAHLAADGAAASAPRQPRTDGPTRRQRLQTLAAWGVVIALFFAYNWFRSRLPHPSFSQLGRIVLGTVSAALFVVFASARLRPGSVQAGPSLPQRLTILVIAWLELTLFWSYWQYGDAGRPALVALFVALWPTMYFSTRLWAGVRSRRLRQENSAALALLRQGDGAAAALRFERLVLATFTSRAHLTTLGNAANAHLHAGSRARALELLHPKAAQLLAEPAELCVALSTLTIAYALDGQRDEADECLDALLDVLPAASPLLLWTCAFVVPRRDDLTQSATLAETLGEVWPELARALSPHDLRSLAVLRAFAAARSATTAAAAATTAAAEVAATTAAVDVATTAAAEAAAAREPIGPGDVAWMTAKWPELAAFVAANRARN